MRTSFGKNIFALTCLVTSADVWMWKAISVELVPTLFNFFHYDLSGTSISEWAEWLSVCLLHTVYTYCIDLSTYIVVLILFYLCYHTLCIRAGVNVIESVKTPLPDLATSTYGYLLVILYHAIMNNKIASILLSDFKKNIVVKLVLLRTEIHPEILHG